MDWIEHIGSALSAVPPHLQTLVLAVVLFGTYQVVYVRYIAPRANGNGTKKLEEAVANHLTTAIEKNTEVVGRMEGIMQRHADATLGKADQLVVAMRNAEEQNHRVANSMNVVMNKIDGIRDLMIEVKASQR